MHPIRCSVVNSEWDAELIELPGQPEREQQKRVKRVKRDILALNSVITREK